MLIEEIDHVAMIVRDAEEWAQYYIGKFGLRRIADEELADPNAKLVYLEAGNVVLQLLEPRGPGELMDDLSRSGDAWHHVCFRVADLDGFLRGLPGGGDAKTFVGGGGGRACFLSKTPVGARIEVIEREEARHGSSYQSRSAPVDRSRKLDPS